MIWGIVGPLPKYSMNRTEFRSIVERINTYLEDFGHLATGKPIFRCVFSTDQREDRKGEYAEFHGKMYLRTVTGIKNMPKYPNNQDMYLIERWCPPHLCKWDELPDSKENGSYEPIWFFMTEDCQALPPNLEVAQIVMRTL